MIGKLKGIVEHIDKDTLLLDVGGVCYCIFLSSRSLQQLPSIGEATSIFTETHVREDHIHLYGFLSQSEQQWFNLLCTVQGVGAKMGLAILSSFTPSDLVQAIHARDNKLLTRASGVGPKLGERLVTELKNKIDSMPTGDSNISDSSPSPVAKTNSPETEEAVSALENLGYGRSDIYGVVTSIQSEDPELKLEDLIRLSLQRLSK